MYDKQGTGCTGEEVRQQAVYPCVTPGVMAGLLSAKDDISVAASGVHSYYGLLSIRDDDKRRLATWYLVAGDIVFT